MAQVYIGQMQIPIFECMNIRFVRNKKKHNVKFDNVTLGFVRGIYSDLESRVPGKPIARGILKSLG